MWLAGALHQYVTETEWGRTARPPSLLAPLQTRAPSAGLARVTSSARQPLQGQRASAPQTLVARTQEARLRQQQTCGRRRLVSAPCMCTSWPITEHYVLCSSTQLSLWIATRLACHSLPRTPLQGVGCLSILQWRLSELCPKSRSHARSGRA